MMNVEESILESCSRMYKCPHVTEQKNQVRRTFMCQIKESHLYSKCTGSKRNVLVEVILSGLHFKVSLATDVRVVRDGEDSMVKSVVKFCNNLQK